MVADPKDKLLSSDKNQLQDTTRKDNSIFLYYFYIAEFFKKILHGSRKIQIAVIDINSNANNV